MLQARDSSAAPPSRPVPLRYAPPPLVSLDAWPTTTIRSRAYLSTLRQSHAARPLLALSQHGEVIPPAQYERALTGAITCAEFSLFHEEKDNHLHSFSAWIEKITVLSPPAAF